VIYYRVKKRSDSHKTIKMYEKERKEAIFRRLKFIEKQFPGTDSSKWTIVYWNSREWAVIPPEGFSMPDTWKMASNHSGGFVPRRSLKKEKEIWAEMYDSSMHMPDSGYLGARLGIDLGARLGIEPHMENQGLGFRIYSCGLEATKSGTYILTLHEMQKAPLDCVRISDITREKLLKNR